MESKLDRIIELSKSIRDELQSDKMLSDILPQARFLAEMNGDVVEAMWLDCEIHGKEIELLVPRQLPTMEEQRGAKIFRQLHTIMDYKKSVASKKSQKDAATHYKESSDNIRTLENFAISKHPQLKKHIYGLRSEADKERLVIALESERVLMAVKAEIYRYVSRVWLDAVQEKENQSLLGPDYRIVVDNLEALQTGVGQELLAALENLRNENPANWKLAALGCRNVIIKLGDSLWKVPCAKYFSELDNKELDLVGEREKNRLYAYIDCHHKRIEEQENKDTLKQLHGKVWPIYDIGSKGKRTIRHEEAKTILVDTFEFVAKLDAITGLAPLEVI